MDNISNLPTHTDDGELRAVVETPRGSTVKIDFDPRLGTFEVSRSLSLGLAYPYDWGFFPSTLAPDGDPLDVMVIHDASTYPGVTIGVRVLGVVEISQKSESGKGRERNDRIIAVPTCDKQYRDLRDITKRQRKQIEGFFLNASKPHAEVKVEGWGSPKRALEIIRAAQRAYADGSTEDH